MTIQERCSTVGLLQTGNAQKFVMFYYTVVHVLMLRLIGHLYNQIVVNFF